MGKGTRNRDNPKRVAFLAAKFPPPLQFRWRAGPYRPPVVNVGMVLHDEHRGADVKVEGVTDAPIPWPAASYRMGRRESLLPILCGDLVRAVCEEDELTVCALLGREPLHGGAWKRSISEAEKSNDVFAGLVMKRNDPTFRKQFGYH